MNIRTLLLAGATVSLLAVPAFAQAPAAPAAPAAVPPPILERIHAATVKALGEKEIADPMIAQGALIRPMTPAEFAGFIRQERDKWGPVVKASGAKME